jgi:hypothetical protein
MRIRIPNTVGNCDLATWLLSSGQRSSPGGPLAAEPFSRCFSTPNTLQQIHTQVVKDMKETGNHRFQGT